MKLLAIDPGRQKCGIAVVEFRDAIDRDGTILFRAIEAADSLRERLHPIVEEFAPGEIALGNSTASPDLLRDLPLLFPHIAVVSVGEAHSTLEARALYWRVHAPRGWRRLVPLSLQTPPEAIDDFAAVVIARRRFGIKCSED